MNAPARLDGRWPQLRQECGLRRLKHRRRPSPRQRRSRTKEKNKPPSWIDGEIGVTAAFLHLTTMEGTATWTATHRRPRTTYPQRTTAEEEGTSDDYVTANSTAATNSSASSEEQKNQHAKKCHRR